MLDSMGPWQMLIDDDDFRGANINLKRQKKELRAHGERRGARQERDTIGIDLGYGCHKKTSEEYSYSNISSFCLLVFYLFVCFELKHPFSSRKKLHLRINASFPHSCKS